MPAHGWKPRDADVLTALDDRKVSLFRLALAVSALLVVSITELNARGLTYLALGIYIAYSAIIYAVARRKKLSWGAFVAMLAIDIAAPTAMISIGAGSNSSFFFLYYFPIIVGGMRGGSAFGFGVTTVAAFLFTMAATIGVPSDSIDFLFLLRPLYLLGLGYVISLWAGAEILLKRKLALLRELSLTTNPRLNVDRIIADFVGRLLVFYEARSCVLVLTNPDGETYRLHRAFRRSLKRVSESIEIQNENECPLLDMSRFNAGVYRENEGFRVCIANEDDSLLKAKPIQAMYQSCSQTAEWLDARSFITAPMRHRNKVLGQICLTSAAPAAFIEEDAVFLQQIVDQIIPVLENVRLVDRLATEAAGHERGRIARSIHDRVIQPYLGLQIGLDAVRQSLRSELKGSAGAAVTPGGLKSVELLERLSAMTKEGVEELRDYVDDLRRPEGRRARLVDSMRRFANQFSDVTGIEVNVEDKITDIVLHDRLAAEVFQMVTEALSNVRRHTPATSVKIHLESVDNTLFIRCSNDDAGEGHFRPFRPRSISDRAEALGGRTQVYSAEGQTTVLVEVPL
jgi:signal transduction histidine kinase